MSDTINFPFLCSSITVLPHPLRNFRQTEAILYLPKKSRAQAGAKAPDGAAKIEPGVDPIAYVVPKIERNIRVRASTVVSCAGSAVAEAVGRPFHYQKLLIQGHCAFIDEFTVTNEVMPLHSHHKGRHMNLRDCARRRVVSAAPIYLALVQRVLGLDGVGAQERSDRQIFERVWIFIIVLDVWLRNSHRVDDLRRSRSSGAVS